MSTVSRDLLIVFDILIKPCVMCVLSTKVKSISVCWCGKWTRSNSVVGKFTILPIFLSFLFSLFLAKKKSGFTFTLRETKIISRWDFHEYWVALFCLFHVNERCGRSGKTSIVNQNEFVKNWKSFFDLSLTTSFLMGFSETLLLRSLRLSYVRDVTLCSVDVVVCWWRTEGFLVTIYKLCLLSMDVAKTKSFKEIISAVVDLFTQNFWILFLHTLHWHTRSMTTNLRDSLD